MTHLCVHAVVGRPVAATRKALQDYIAQQSRPDGSVPVPLRVPLLSNLAARLALAHTVPVSFWQGRAQDDLDAVLLIEWTPKGVVPYPAFSGIVQIYPTTDPHTARLEIDGAYEPPGGIAGRAFDALIGARIARISLTGLVERLACEIVAR